MKIINVGYAHTPSYTHPEQWLRRISFHTGILEELATRHPVESIEQIRYSGLLDRKGVKYHFLDFKNAGSKLPFRLNRYIKKLNPDVVFVNGFIFPLQTMQLRWALGNKVKIAVINHAEKPSTGRRKFLQRLADKCVDLYFFTSKEMGAAWVQQSIIAHENKIAEVMEASSSFSVMNRQEARAITKVSGNPVFLWVGRLDTNKDPLTALNAFEKFIYQHPQAKLYMIFHTEELLEEVKRMIQQNTALQDAVVLVGKVVHEEMQYWHSSADFIIAASHSEGSGIAVCEAMSCGCIPILTSIPSFRKMTGRGSCGLLFEPGNAAQLLERLLQTDGLDMQEEKRKVLDQFEKELSFKAIAKKMDEAIASLCTR